MMSSYTLQPVGFIWRTNFVAKLLRPFGADILACSHFSFRSSGNNSVTEAAFPERRIDRILQSLIKRETS